jgi:hypothetical protein
MVPMNLKVQQIVDSRINLVGHLIQLCENRRQIHLCQIVQLEAYSSYELFVHAILYVW